MESISIMLLTEMKTKSFGEEGLFSGDCSVLYPSVGPASKMVFLFFCNMSACLKCSEARLLCFIYQAVTNSSEIL